MMMVMVPEGLVRRDEVEALVFSISDRRSSSFDQRDADPVTKTLNTERETLTPTGSTASTRLIKPV